MTVFCNVSETKKPNRGGDKASPAICPGISISKYKFSSLISVQVMTPNSSVSSDSKGSSDSGPAVLSDSSSASAMLFSISDDPGN